IFHKPLHVDARPQIDSWLSSSEKRSTSVPIIIHRPFHIQSRSRIDTWQKLPYRRDLTNLKVIHKPMHVHAHSKIDAWGIKTIKRMGNTPMIENHPVHVTGQSRIDSWLVTSTSKQRRYKKRIQHQPLYVSARAQIDSWNVSQVKRRSSAPQVHRPLHFDARARIDTWRSASSNPVLSDFKFYNKPIHVDARSRIDSWLSTSHRRALSKINSIKNERLHLLSKHRVDCWREEDEKKKRISHSLSVVKTDPFNFDNIKPTINTWNNYRKSKSAIDIAHKPIHVEARSKLDTWLFYDNDDQNRTYKKIINEKVVIDSKSRIDTWNTVNRKRTKTAIDQYKSSSRIFRYSPRSRIDCWKQVSSSSRQKSSHYGLEFHHRPINIVAKSTLNTWNDITRSSQHHHQSFESKHAPHHYLMKSKVDCWQIDREKRSRSLSATVINNRRLNFENVKPTINTWNNYRKSMSAIDINFKPIHVEARSKIDTWKMNVNRDERRSKVVKSKPYNIDAKSTLNTWNTTNLFRRYRSVSMSLQKKSIYTNGKAKVETWSNHQQKRRKSASTIELNKNRPLYIDAKATINTWRENHFEKSSIRKIPSFVHKPININAKSTIDTWNTVNLSHQQDSTLLRKDSIHHIDGKAKVETWLTQQQQKQRKLTNITNTPIYVNAKATIDTWRTDKSSDRKQLASINHPINIDGKSTLDTWNNLPLQRHQTPSINHPINIDGKSTLDTWNNLPLQRHQTPSINHPINIDGKSTLDTWNNLPLQHHQTSSSDKVIHKPIHIVGHSQIDSWSNIKTSKRHHSASDSEIKHKPVYIQPRSTIDNWMNEIDVAQRRTRSLSSTTLEHKTFSTSMNKPVYVEGKPIVDTWLNGRYRRSRIRSRYILSPERSMIKEESTQLNLYEKQPNQEQQIESKPIHFDPATHIDCWNWSYLSYPKTSSRQTLSALERKRLSPLRKAADYKIDDVSQYNLTKYR
ncbi:unnamed protein product, partial [Didymodactylos carnosus]